MSTTAPAPASEATPAVQPAAAPATNNRTPRQPEKKIGPFAGGVGVAIWLNQTETPEGGIRHFRTLTINPRRFFDRESNQWKDAPSYNSTDLPSLIFSLQKALEFMFETPLPGAMPGVGGAEDQEVPF